MHEKYYIPFDQLYAKMYSKSKERSSFPMNTQMYNELVMGILDVVGIKTVSIILYGSTVKGTATDESDIDIAVIVDGALDLKMEDALSDVVVDMNLKYDKVFSVIDIEDETIKKWENVVPFYQNVRKEGIVLWKAA